ncbi:MAG: hypothetical protein HDT50_04375 [Lactobacillus sp.]|nr:hypothetical protein [Lactobacillus sp.]
MKFSKFLGTKALYRILSLFFALLLFFFVSYQRLGSTRVSDKEVAQSNLTTNKSLTLKVPLTLNVDSNKYYVTGYPEKIKVEVSGPSALVTALDNTRNFEVYADLSGLKTGTHTVKLKTSGFSKELSVALVPEKITVKIATKKTVKMPIQVRYDADQIQKDYVAGTPTISQQTVEVIGAKSEVAKLDSVVANVNLPNNTHTSYSRTVLLQALDKKGRVLNVSLSPETVKVTVPISQATTTKNVKVKLVAENNGVAGKKYQLSTDTKTIQVRGTKSALSKLSSFEVPVSVAGVNESTTRTIKLSPTQSGIASVSPASIEVQIDVSDESTTETSTEAALNESSVKSSSSQATSSEAKSTVSSSSSTKSSKSESSSETSSSSSTSSESTTTSSE